LSRGSLLHKTLDGKSLVQGNRQGNSRSDSRSSAQYSDDVDRGPAAHRHAQRVRDAGALRRRWCAPPTSSHAATPGGGGSRQRRCCRAAARTGITVGPNPCSFWHRVHGPRRVESTFFVHEGLPHVHFLVLVKHCEVRKKHECLLSVHMHTHSRRRPWRRLPPPPSATAWAGRRHATRLSATRLTAYHPNRILSDTKNAHRNQNCAHLVCTSLLRLCTCSYRVGAQLRVRRLGTIGSAWSSQWCGGRCLRS